MVYSQCQIQIGTFESPGEKLFDDNYGSGPSSLLYKIYIPPDIDMNATMDNDTFNIPVLVMVHGSGSGNHDEQIGSIYVFRDIAEGLCINHNIIVFTYDKRSCSSLSNPQCLNNTPFCELYPDNPPNPCINVTHLTYLDFVGDAISAVKYIKETFEFIHPDNIIPTGHSQGASYVPLVADYMNLTTAISLMGSGYIVYYI